MNYGEAERLIGRELDAFINLSDKTDLLKLQILKEINLLSEPKNTYLDDFYKEISRHIKSKDPLVFIDSINDILGINKKAQAGKIKLDRKNLSRFERELRSIQKEMDCLQKEMAVEIDVFESLDEKVEDALEICNSIDTIKYNLRHLESVAPTQRNIDKAPHHGSIAMYFSRNKQAAHYTYLGLSAYIDDNNCGFLGDLSNIQKLKSNMDNYLKSHSQNEADLKSSKRNLSQLQSKKEMLDSRLNRAEANYNKCCDDVIFKELIGELVRHYSKSGTLDDELSKIGVSSALDKIQIHEVRLEAKRFLYGKLCELSVSTARSANTLLANHNALKKAGSARSHWTLSDSESLAESIATNKKYLTELVSWIGLSVPSISRQKVNLNVHNPVAALLQGLAKNQHGEKGSWVLDLLSTQPQKLGESDIGRVTIGNRTLNHGITRSNMDTGNSYLDTIATSNIAAIATIPDFSPSVSDSVSSWGGSSGHSGCGGISTGGDSGGGGGDSGGGGGGCD